MFNKRLVGRPCCEKKIRLREFRRIDKKMSRFTRHMCLCTPDAFREVETVTGGHMKTYEHFFGKSLSQSTAVTILRTSRRGQPKNGPIAGTNQKNVALKVPNRF